jgi:hypothetical protein
MSQLGTRPRGGARPWPVIARRTGWLYPAGTVLAAGAALLAALGPLRSGPAGGRTSSSTVNAPVGAETVALVVLALTLLVASWLAHRRQPSGALLLLGAAAAVSHFAAGVVLGADPSVAPRSDADRVALGVLVLVLAMAVVRGAWHALPAGSVTFERRTRALVGTLLLTAVGAVVLGHHVTAWVSIAAGRPPVEYLADARAWWVGTTLDLLFLLPATAAGVGLLRRALWAAPAAFASSGCLGLIGLLVVAEASGGPAGSWGTAWIAPVTAVTAATPTALCWVAVVRTGRQYWRGSPTAPTTPIPSSRLPLVSTPRSLLDAHVSPLVPGSAGVGERTARRSGT